MVDDLASGEEGAEKELQGLVNLKEYLMALGKRLVSRKALL